MWVIHIGTAALQRNVSNLLAELSVPLDYIAIFIQPYASISIPANPHPAVPTVSAKSSMSRLSARVYPSMWAAHLAVALSVHFHQSVALTRLAYSTNVLIRVQGHAAAMHSVMPQIMLRCAHATLDILEIRLLVAIPYLVSHFMSTH